MELTLCIDIGNQTTAFGLFEADPVRPSVSHGVNRIINPKKVFNKELLTLKSHLPKEKVSAIFIASVIPNKNEVFSRILQGFYNVTPKFINAAILKGAYPSLGADRVANLFGGKEVLGTPVCVIDLGTATTIDVLGANDKYIGGVIIPGINLESEVLHKKTAQLPLVPIVETQGIASLLGKSTEECINSGVLWGEYYRIGDFITEIKKLVPSCEFIFTGGLGKNIAELLNFPYDEWLTLKGIYLLANDTLYNKFLFFF